MVIPTSVVCEEEPPLSVIPNEVRNLLSSIEGVKRPPFRTDTKCRPERSEGSPIIGKG